jgi:hypothetical protein
VFDLSQTELYFFRINKFFFSEQPSADVDLVMRCAVAMSAVTRANNAQRNCTFEFVAMV